MISSVFVDRPRLAIVIAIILTIAGSLALLRIPVAQFPDIVPPQVRVSATYPGASAQVVESSVAQPLEAQVVGVDQMLYMKSTSGNDGTYSLNVSFALGTNPDIDTVNVNNRVQTALSQLPAQVQLQGLTVQKRSSAVLQFMMFYSDNGQQDPLFITNYATINVLDELSRTPGVGQASLFGLLKYSMRIWFDVERLNNLGMAPSEIVAAIQSQNVQAPVGRIGAQPIASDQQFQFNLQTKGRLTTPEEFGAIVVRANQDGSLIRVRDVARVEIGAQNSDNFSRLDGKPAVAVGIYLAPGANAVQTAAAVNATLAKVGKRFPEGLKTKVVYDSTTFVTDTIAEVLKTIGEAFVLVVFVVFLFLGNLRATIIPAVAVPVSLIGTFAVLLVMGYSANTVSLLAMVLAIGIVVDDAIVVVENVERVMEEDPHLTPGEATKKAMREITAPIIAITLVLLSVFVPLAFIPGLTGVLFRQCAVTISVAMLISAINALTLSPALCGIFLRPGGHKGGIMGRILQGIDKTRHGYAAVVTRLVRVSAVSLLIIAGFAVGIYFAALRTPTGFLPEEDQGAFFVSIQLPDGASVSRTSDTVKTIEDQLLKMPQVADTLRGHRLFVPRHGERTQFRLHGRQAEAVRGSRGGAGFRSGHDRQGVRHRPAGANRERHRVQPAADHRTVDRRRLRIRPRGPRGPGPERHGQRRARADLDRERRSPTQSASSRPSRRSTPRSTSTSTARRRSALGVNISDIFGVLNAHRWAAIYQRLQPLWPHLAGQHRGRGEGQARHRVDLADLRQEQDGCRSAAALPGVAAHRPGSAGHHALQQLPRHPDPREPRPGRLVRDRADRHGVAVGQDAAQRLRLRVDRHGLPGICGQRDRRVIVLGLAVLFAYLFLVRLYESWLIPVPVLLSVTVGVFGAFIGIILAGLVARPLRPGRPRGADRAGGQERHPDRGIRQGTRERGRVGHRLGHRGREMRFRAV